MSRLMRTIAAARRLEVGDSRRADHAPVTIYTRALCPYCRRAKRLLKREGVVFREVTARQLGGRPGLRERFGPSSATFPQIVIGDALVGGADELAALAASGELVDLLAATARRRGAS